MSVVAPGANATTRWIGRWRGQSCARAPHANTARRHGRKRKSGMEAPRPDATIAARMKILFASQIEPADRWLPLLQEVLPKDQFLLAPQDGIEVALVASPPAGTLARLHGVKLVQSLWMGVEKLL